ncbi:Probable methyltransferase [Mycobacteroides abscessus subsp. abscessus]|nr:Probable methyltransferase [Mycobacteroides abscessus subsp. abscessus]
MLEVGCGHGGGASYLVRALQPASYTGMDLNPDGISFCRRRHDLPGLEFVQGDAEDLPFPDESFDAVINVESSHLYPHFPVFLTEVARVLRPGGNHACSTSWHSPSLRACSARL